MPGEQLTCVVHLAYERYGESLLHRSAIYQALVDINWDRYSCLTKEDFFPCSTKVKFSKLKTFILKRNINITEKELGDNIEKACWNLCQHLYSACPFGSSQIYKLWRIFIRVADENTYPPVLKPSYSNWIIEKFFPVADLSKTTTSASKYLTFQDFLRSFEDRFTAESLDKVVTEIYHWLVKEVIKAGWVYMTIKQRGESSPWDRRCLNISPGKLHISKQKHGDFIKAKCDFYITKNTQIRLDESKHSGVKHVINVSNDVLECLIAVTNAQEITLWLQALHQSLDHSLGYNSHIQYTLKTARNAPKRLELSFMQYENDKEGRNKSKIEKHSKMHDICVHRLNSVNTEKEKIEVVFLNIDKNGNGTLEFEEFRRALDDMGLKMSESESSTIFNLIDSHGHGRIEFMEFYDFFLENILCDENSPFCKAFEEADQKGRGVIDFKEFSKFVRTRNRSVSLDKVMSCFDNLCGEAGKDELSRQDFIHSMSVLDELGLFPNSLEDFEVHLQQKFEACDTNELKYRIQKRWGKFASFRRAGENGKVAMTGPRDIVGDILPGEYSLEDLAQGNESLPRRTIVRGVSWKLSNIENTSGELIFPSDFSGFLQVEMATNTLLAYYGCEFAEGKSKKVDIPFRSAIQDFTYEKDYLTNYVERKNKGSGLERHAFPHLDCPLTNDSGFFILGKFIENELHITAFRIPERRTLYIPGNCIHSNDYLRGTWRTMLSDGCCIDHVHLKKAIRKKKKGAEENDFESFSFQFWS